MSKRKHARTAKTRTASKVRAKAARRQITNDHQTRANSKQARVLALLPSNHSPHQVLASLPSRRGVIGRTRSPITFNTSSSMGRAAHKKLSRHLKYMARVRIGGIELLGHRDKGNVVLVE
jgi:hypothetical protein